MICIPVVTRFFCPPEIPLLITSPTIISEHISSPRICFTSADYISVEPHYNIRFAHFFLPCLRNYVNFCQAAHTYKRVQDFIRNIKVTRPFTPIIVENMLIMIKYAKTYNLLILNIVEIILFNPISSLPSCKRKLYENT